MSRSTRFLSDDALLAQCRVEQMRGSGPGGQKRNKTSNAVRITHSPSGVSASASESRSQLENKLWAIRRIRIKLSAELREPVAERFEPPDWFLSIRRNEKIEASHRHEFYAASAGLILDLLNEMRGNPADVGAMLGISTTSVIKFLESDPAFWTAANRIRQDAGLTPLTPRR